MRGAGGAVRTHRQRLARLRRDALWYDDWLRTLSAKYRRPLYEIERMPMGAFYQEIAILWAETIVATAARLRDIPSDSDAAGKLRAERRRVKTSKAWYDRLIAERMALDAERERKP